MKEALRKDSTMNHPQGFAIQIGGLYYWICTTLILSMAIFNGGAASPESLTVNTWKLPLAESPNNAFRLPAGKPAPSFPPLGFVRNSERGIVTVAHFPFVVTGAIFPLA